MILGGWRGGGCAARPDTGSPERCAGRQWRGGLLRRHGDTERGGLWRGGAYREVAGVELGDVGGGHGQGGQGGGADGEALADGGGGVAHGVEVVGAGAHVAAELGHLGDAAGVVGHRAVGVNRELDAGGGEHADSGQGHAVQAGEVGQTTLS